jgi:type IV pilus assembly protein PilQ
MIANSAARTRWAELGRAAGRLATAIVCAAIAAGILHAAVEPTRLVGVTAEGDAVLIEASEPAAYSVSRPDSTTLVVDMRNVSVADARADVPRQGVIAGVRLEQATAVDGRALARVHLSLTRPSEHAVRSSRNTIRVELTPRAGSGKSPAASPKPATAAAPLSPAPPAAAPPPPARPARAETVQQPPSTSPIEVAQAPAGAATMLERIQPSRSASATTITLSGDGYLHAGTVKESKDLPRRLVLDFPNVTSKAPTQTTIESPLVSRIRVGLNSSQPLVTRVVMEIAGSTNYYVSRSGDNGRDLQVVFEPGAPIGTAVPEAAPASPKRAEREAPITLQPGTANVASITPKDPAGSTAPPVDAMAVLRASVVTPPASASAAASSTSSGPAPPAATLTPTEPPAPQPKPAVPALATAPTAPPVTQPPVTPPPSTPPPATPPPATPALAQATPARQGDQRQYTGHPISLDFEAVDLRAVLRTFADVSGLNMVIDPDVQGTVDIKLTDVPWDQALDVILRGNQLDYSVDGTIVRISRIKTLEDENKSRQSAAQAASERAAQAGGLTFETFPLSYAKAAEMAPLLKGSLRLSKWGQVQIDARTNTLIVADLPAQLPAIRELLRTLDRAEPQVEVEARIVQTSRDFAKAIGVQWGLNGRVMPDVGNTTGLAFPNRGTIGGRNGTQAPTDPRSTDLEQTGTAVRLGLPDATTAIGLALGAVNGAFNLDVALSALERTGKGRVLSTPRLTTQNNIQAEVAQGVQIPIQTVSNNTVTVTFKDAVLVLRVTPQITAANTVIMKVEIENATADFSRQVNGIPPVDTQRAITQVQIDDGATTVIGGIFVSQEQSTSDKTPILHRLPILGWLFKQDRIEDESRELLIFITPRILKG